MKEITFNPDSHPAGINTCLKLTDGKEVKGIVFEYTGDAVFIKTEDKLERVHPHEIEEVIE